MSKTILAEVDGWTPLIDALSRVHGLVTSAVFGRMWRYCQGEKGLCTASLETIASDLGIDKATVMRHARKLVENGYLIDTTPGLRNVPHVYADTGKAGIRVQIGVAEGNATVAEGNATVAESQLKRGIKRESKRGGDTRSQHPAILCVKGILGHYPPIELYDDIIRVLGESPNSEQLVSCRKEWLQRGYNPNAWIWLLEWYRDGTGGNAAQTRKPPTRNLLEGV